VFTCAQDNSREISSSARRDFSPSVSADRFFFLIPLLVRTHLLPRVSRGEGQKYRERERERERERRQIRDRERVSIPRSQCTPAMLDIRLQPSLLTPRRRVRFAFGTRSSLFGEEMPKISTRACGAPPLRCGIAGAVILALCGTASRCNGHSSSTMAPSEVEERRLLRVDLAQREAIGSNWSRKRCSYLPHIEPSLGTRTGGRANHGWIMIIAGNQHCSNNDRDESDAACLTANSEGETRC